MTRKVEGNDNVPRAAKDDRQGRPGPGPAAVVTPPGPGIILPRTENQPCGPVAQLVRAGDS